MEMEIESESTHTKILDNKYLLLSKLGEGGTSKVYLVRDKETNKEYAAKVLEKESSHFEDEMNLLQKISHPNIINIKGGGVGEILKNSIPSEKHQYIILELAQKGELLEYVYCPAEGFPEKYSRPIFKKILEGLEACHQAGVAHRDMKMDNVMLDDDYNPKIADFGFAALLQGKDGDGILRTPLGTVEYMAPEILTGKAYEGTKVDVYSTGILLFTLITGKKPFSFALLKDKQYQKIMAKLYKTYWNDLKGHVPECSEEFKKLYVKMVAYNPKDRPSVKEILEDPWLKGEYATEEELKTEFERRHKIVVEKNENKGIFSDDDEDNINQRGGDDTEYFGLDLKPTKINGKNIKVRRFFKIHSRADGSKFMNALCNKIKNDYDNCDIEASKKKLMFNVIFDKKTVVEEEEKDEEILKDLEEFDGAVLEEEKCTIKVELAQTEKDEYLLCLFKKNGDVEEFYENYEKVKKSINSLL